jgi:hypothetical protein
MRAYVALTGLEPVRHTYSRYCGVQTVGFLVYAICQVTVECSYIISYISSRYAPEYKYIIGTP